jgi:HemK-like putative methylase
MAGSQPFGPLNLHTRPPTLIPRPETEHWTIQLAEQLLSKKKSSWKILDLGTGTGCIPLLLCHLLKGNTIRALGVDISTAAVALANENAALCGYQDTYAACRADMLSPGFSEDSLPLQPPFDVVTSNPPYISQAEYLDLHPSVSQHEDRRALLGGPDGLDFYHAISRIISRPGFLSRSAIVALEVGHTQAPAVQTILGDHGFQSEVWLDPWQKPRTVVARSKS